MERSIVKPEIPGRTVTVGGAEADVHGFDSMAIQKAIDLLRVRGGGTVRLDSGVFQIFGPVRLYDNITLTGAGESTVLKKVPGFRTRFVIDADYGELQATVEDASGFRPGMGIILFDSGNRFGWDVSTAVITAVEGNTIYFDNYLVRDYRSGRDSYVSNACSIVEGVCVENAAVSNLLIDGSAESNDMMGGCRGGGIYFHKARRCTVENVKVTNFNGDGMSWQITEDISVINCEVWGCTNLGIHPGTGSLRSSVIGGSFHDNGSDGIFVCWRVQHGIFRDNRIFGNGGSGINIGHKDTDNLFENNHIFRNKFSGIHIRVETDSNAAHRNVYRKNIIEDNGSEKGGFGFFINALVKGNVIEENIIRDTGRGLQKVGIMINRRLPDIKIVNNEMSGHSDGDVVQKSENG